MSRPGPAVDDLALLDAYRRGERWALKRVCEATWDTAEAQLRRGFTFSSGATRHRFRGVMDPDVRRDLLADVYAAAFEPSARRAYDPSRPFLPYLLQIARNLVIDRFRDGTREAGLLERLSAEAGVAATSTTAADETYLSLEEVDQARRYVETLDPRERTVFELRIGEELGRDEVGRRAGLTVSQVRTSETRIIEGFRRFLSTIGWTS